MARELLPATFATEQAAANWAAHLPHESRVVPATDKDKLGRFQVEIRRQKKEPA